MPTKLRKKSEVMDPQCGKAIDPDHALKLSWEGKTYFFCCEDCRRRFEADPPGDAGF